MGNNASFFTPNAGMMNAATQAMRAGGKQAFYGSAYDAQMASGMAYLVGELEKVDPKIREPLSSVTWQRDIVAKTGGGWVEFTSTFEVDYGTGPMLTLSLAADPPRFLPCRLIPVKTCSRYLLGCTLCRSPLLTRQN